MNRRDFLSRSAVSALALKPSKTLGPVEGMARGQAAGPKEQSKTRSGVEGQTIFRQVRDGRGLAGVDAVDTHAHFHEIFGKLFWPRSAKALVADANHCGIGLTIASPVAGYVATSGEQLKAAHDACVKAVEKYRESLRAYLVFQPHLLKTSIEEMKRILEPGTPFVGFGEVHGAVDQYAADGPNFQPLFEFCNEHRLHVLYHVWGGIRPVARTVEKYPNMTLAMAHMAFWNGATAEEVIAILKEHSNLYVDTCSSTWPFGYLERFVRAVGAEKILFATDCTYLAIGPQLAKVAFANFSEDEKRLIFGGNARRIFGSRLPARTSLSARKAFPPFAA